MRLKSPGEIAQGLEQAGKLKTYDWAMPQDWFDEVLIVTKINPSGHIVWCYDNSLCGFPYAIDMLGYIILNTFNLHEKRMKDQESKRIIAFLKYRQ